MDNIKLDILERRYVLDLIDRYHGNSSKESEFGYKYNIEELPGKCIIESPDGTFSLDSKKITIMVGELNE